MALAIMPRRYQQTPCSVGGVRSESGRRGSRGACVSMYWIRRCTHACYGTGSLGSSTACGISGEPCQCVPGWACYLVCKVTLPPLIEAHFDQRPSGRRTACRAPPCHEALFLCDRTLSCVGTGALSRRRYRADIGQQAGRQAASG